MADDLLNGASWYCSTTPVGFAGDLDTLDTRQSEWLPATVPGTAAGALRDAGWPIDGRDFDDADWWFRCRFAAPANDGKWLLHFGGLATIADVWLNGAHLLHSENMFVAHVVECATLQDDNELVLRFAALTPFLNARRPRPRWKTYLIAHQNLRWLRTTLLGRLPGWAAIPAPVGPWRSVHLERKDAITVSERRVVARCVDDEGVIDVRVRFRAVNGIRGDVVLRAAGQTTTLAIRSEGEHTVASGCLRIAAVERWWPHTHGSQPLYPLEIDLDGQSFPLGRVGFRTVEVDRRDGAFVVRVNGVKVFCRGAVWMPVDPVSLSRSAEDLRSALLLARDAHMNMIRLPGTGVYEDEEFWDTCDELGLMVWQDCMFAFADPPDDPAFAAEVNEELTHVFAGLGGRPSLTVLCGGQEIESQAAMLGVPRDKWYVPLLDETIPHLAAKLLPGTVYVSSNPSGGDLPFQMDQGVCHFFGIGGYLRPLDDARRASVRFATECLAFATPAEASIIDDEWGGSAPAGHDPRWKLGVHHDAGRSWDLEDMHSHYVQRTFNVDPFVLRWSDPDRAQDLARATAVAVMTEVMTEWRREESTCSGGIVLAMRDLRRGGGWGVADSSGRPKAPWFALRRVFQPMALLLTDEGLNGLHLHVINDAATNFAGTISLSLFTRGELCVERVDRTVEVAARSSLTIEAASLFDEWWDLSYAYGFGPSSIDIVAAELTDRDGKTVSDVCHLPSGPNRAVEADIGLAAHATLTERGRWLLTVSTRRFAQWVAVDVPGYRPDDSWFHLAPHASRALTLHPIDQREQPSGRVSALNAWESVRITTSESNS